MGYIVYNSNNSGGDWWLGDDNWKALEANGWVVHWYHDPDDPSHSHSREDVGTSLGCHSHRYGDPLLQANSDGDRWLGALAVSAAKETNDPAGAIEEWERTTGMRAGSVGCNCCGPPHTFEYTDDSGKTTYIAPADVCESELEWY